MLSCGHSSLTQYVQLFLSGYGLELKVHTPRGAAYTRVGFGAPLNSTEQLRPAVVDLVRRGHD